MDFKFVAINLEYLAEIKDWKYDGFIKKIYVDPYFENTDENNIELRGPGGCIGFVALTQNKLAGLFEYYFRGEIIEIGLALNPAFVGKGYGKDFVEQGIAFGIEYFAYQEEYIKLNVNINNKAARRVYKKAGFKEYDREDDSIEMRKYI
ncbi:GNAT family N-acetyltransferase [Halanaerobium kushneri]|jgi:ribosomal-protein-alanine N-acetyltransferase|uniref:Ribosomal-protein-alanine N-acetyltransferase n=1 Tax=Halanaerobium kushneri TaxID=56779 RepID=A0A1N6YTH7_9FIRM|nr:GNAT family N-acetyltransferase [Halanaerobium kushneri]SIR17913.1 ribosomal-protein-alanine N-acetyltransferase [Halanaerobium kushneri]